MVEKIAGDSLLNIGLQLIPVVPLSENVMRKTFGYKSAVRFLRHSEYDFHFDIIPIGGEAAPNFQSKKLGTLAEQQQITGEKLHALIDTVDRIIRNRE